MPATRKRRLQPQEEQPAMPLETSNVQAEEMEISEPVITTVTSLSTVSETDGGDGVILELVDESIEADATVVDSGPDLETWPITSSSGYVSPDGIAYHVLENSSTHGSDKIFSSDGYSYGLAKISIVSEFRTWRCTKRDPTMNCPAVLKEYRSTKSFVSNRQAHCHPPKPRSFARAQIITALKQQAAKNPTKSIPAMARKLIAKFLPEETISQSLVDGLSRSASRYRRKTVLMLEGPQTSTARINKNKSFTKVKKQKLKKKKKKSRHNDHDYITPLTPPLYSNESFLTESGSDMNPDDFVLVYLPKRHFENMFREGLPMTQRRDLVNRAAAVNEMMSSSSNALTNGTQPSTSGEHSGKPKRDPDEMFFYSLLSEIKELPKLTKSTLKLNILSLVNSALQNQSG